MQMLNILNTSLYISALSRKKAPPNSLLVPKLVTAEVIRPTIVSLSLPTEWSHHLILTIVVRDIFYSLVVHVLPLFSCLETFTLNSTISETNIFISYGTSKAHKV